MPRELRAVVVDCPHHITQRGVNKERVFFRDADRHVYLDLLARHSERHCMDLIGYCLMPNHVHLILTPSDETGLSRARIVRRAKEAKGKT